jgi:hypothetical protein
LDVTAPKMSGPYFEEAFARGVRVARLAVDDLVGVAHVVVLGDERGGVDQLAALVAHQHLR